MKKLEKLKEKTREIKEKKLEKLNGKSLVSDLNSLRRFSFAFPLIFFIGASSFDFL